MPAKVRDVNELKSPDFEQRLAEAQQQPGLRELRALADRCDRLWAIVDDVERQSRDVAIVNSSSSTGRG